MIFCCYYGNHFRTKAIHLKTKKKLCLLKCCHSTKEYLSTLKQHELLVALSKEFLLNCLSVMSYEQFIISIVELIMLSWQQMLYNFHNMRVTWQFYHFLELEVHISHGFLMVGNCDLSDVTSFLVKQALYHRRFPRISEARTFPFGDSLTQLQSLITQERHTTAAIHMSFSSILNSLSYENLISGYSSPLMRKKPHHRSVCCSFPLIDCQSPLR